MGGGDKARDAADLNVHAIAELQKMGIPPTDDSPKYKYADDGKRGLEAQYRMYRSLYGLKDAKFSVRKVHWKDRRYS